MPVSKPVRGSLGCGEILDLGVLLGSTWDGFRLVAGEDQGEFVHAAWRRPFTAGELYSLFWRTQQVTALEIKVRQLERELEQANLRADRADECMAFYRRQLVLESRMGAMLSGFQLS